MLRTVFAALALGSFASQAWAGERNVLDPAAFTIGDPDRDSYEDDYPKDKYDREYDKATKGQYEARDGEHDRLNDKAWEFFEYIKDYDPMWAGPLQFDGAGAFHSLNTRWPMEAARTLDKWKIYLAFSGQMYNQQYDDTHGFGPEDVHWVGLLALGVAKVQIGLPGRFEIGIRYIFGEIYELGSNDIFWYQGRHQVVRTHDRDVGSKAIEGNIKWNLYRHPDCLSGIAINVKGKKSMAERSDMLDTTGTEFGANIMGSLKWGRTSWHLNVGGIFTRNTGTLFHVEEPNGDHPEIRPFLTGGLAFTWQVFDFLMLIAQVEANTNSWRATLDDTYNAHVIGTGAIGVRARVGPMIFEIGGGQRFNLEGPRVFGEATIGVKF